MKTERQINYFNKFLDYLDAKGIDSIYHPDMDKVLRRVDKFLRKHEFYDFDARFYNFKKMVELGR